MTTQFDAYEQVNNQRAIARENRRRHGADMSRDRAEVRHDKIENWVIAMKFWGPVGATALFGGMFNGGDTEAYFVSWVCVIAAMFVAVLLGRIMGAVFGSFHERIQLRTELLFYCIGGALIVAGGLLAGRYGVAISGAALALTPYVWTTWGRSVLSNTDYARMMAEDDDTPAHRIVE